MLFRITSFSQSDESLVLFQDEKDVPWAGLFGLVIWGASVSPRLAAAASTGSKSTRQEEETAKLEALVAAPPMKAKEHKLSPCRLIL